MNVTFTDICKLLMCEGCHDNKEKTQDSAKVFSAMNRSFNNCNHLVGFALRLQSTGGQHNQEGIMLLALCFCSGSAGSDPQGPVSGMYLSERSRCAGDASLFCSCSVAVPKTQQTVLGIPS